MTIDDVLVIGGGPAGLMAAHELVHTSDKKVRLLEADPVYFGGISRTQNYKGFHFDIGGHRFFSKSKEIEAIWKKILPNDLMTRPRLSRIYYNRKFFSYPLRAFEALFNLGIWESTLCMISHVKWRLFPVRQPKSFADWVSNAFGYRLFSIFFKTYTEKVWGMSTDELSADWAAQRIKGLSLTRAIMASVMKSLGQKSSIKTLTETFTYPRLGPGMMWHAAADQIRAKGGVIETDRRAIRFVRDDKQGVWAVTARDGQGQEHVYYAREVISTAPMRDVIQAIQPAMETAKAASKLRYRDFVTVALLMNKPAPFKDNWIYIHDPSVLVGRIQNFAAWSPDMVPSKQEGCLGLEYFCFEGDTFWTTEDKKLVALAKEELGKLGLVDVSKVFDGCVVRQPKAYPVYDDAYHDTVAAIKKELGERYPSFQLAGRNGLHKYDNQDHAMMTALLVARNVIAGKHLYDPWSVNEDAEYHEECAEAKAPEGAQP
ncbi:MAG: NAD(P)/FAD-dependent oxidoreductase [Alphaproteobacteria bacterium]|nr:NAD(P)/FAD-dependent oxidoreductase [Alphaproteobacteria bacterium]